MQDQIKMFAKLFLLGTVVAIADGQACGQVANFDHDDVVAALFNFPTYGCADVKANNECAVAFLDYACTTTCEGKATEDDFKKDQNELTKGHYGMRCPCGASVETFKAAPVALACPESCAAAIAGEELDQATKDACDTAANAGSGSSGSSGSALPVDPHASDRLPISEESGTLGFSTIGA